MCGQKSVAFFILTIFVVCVELSPIVKPEVPGIPEGAVHESENGVTINQGESEETNVTTNEDNRDKNNDAKISFETNNVAPSPEPVGESTSGHEITSFDVTSQPLKISEVKEAPEAPTVLINNDTRSVADTNVSTPVNLDDSLDMNSSTEGNEANVLDKIHPSYQSYIEDILRMGMDPGNDTTEEPSRIKTSGYHQSPLNVLMNPDERQSPNFSESEMNKRRLNYWRIKQILKGDGNLGKFTGRPATSKIIPTPDLLHEPSVNPFGRKRAASFLSTYQNDDMISFLTSADAISDNYEANESNKDSSKLRTIFSWFNKKQSGDQLRLEHAKAQQAILPYALGYRGDFLFW